MGQNTLCAGIERRQDCKSTAKGLGGDSKQAIKIKKTMIVSQGFLNQEGGLLAAGHIDDNQQHRRIALPPAPSYLSASVPLPSSSASEPWPGWYRYSFAPASINCGVEIQGADPPAGLIFKSGIAFCPVTSPISSNDTPAVGQSQWKSLCNPTQSPKY